MKKIDKEVALNDLESFVNKFKKKPVDRIELEEMYPDALEAIMDGFVSFNEAGVPVYTLKDPIKDDKGEIAITTINFQTRILPTRLAEVAKGLNLQKEALMFQLKITAEIIGKTIGTLDKFSPYDYDAISQIATVFQ